MMDCGAKGEQLIEILKAVSYSSRKRMSGM
jgi:hypothetical protein